MYDALTINQLIDCLDNETHCYVIDRNIPHEILICKIVFTSVWRKVVCAGVTFHGEVIPSMIGLSEDHAWALQYSSELDKVQKTIKDAKELEKELMEKLVQFVKKINGE
jgi:hypothetical protein